MTNIFPVSLKFAHEVKKHAWNNWKTQNSFGRQIQAMVMEKTIESVYMLHQQERKCFVIANDTMLTDFAKRTLKTATPFLSAFNFPGLIL